MTGVGTRRTAVASVLLVALVAAVCSYCHMEALAQASGEEWRSHLIPLSVDGMLVAATLAIVDRRRVGRPAGWVPWSGLSLGVLASLAANIAAARSDPISRAIAAWPPVALALSVETLVIVLREPVADQASGSPEKVPENIPGNIPPPVRAGNPSPKPPILPQGSDRTVAETKARALLASNPGMGRRALMAQSGLKEYDARKLLESFRAPRNGHKVLEDA